jgi:hypothetical protein
MKKISSPSARIVDSTQFIAGTGDNKDQAVSWGWRIMAMIDPSIVPAGLKINFP